MRKAICLILLFVLAVMGVSCAFNTQVTRYHALAVLSDWHDQQEVILQARYENGTDEEKAWLRKNVNPYMNIFKWGLIGYMGADSGNYTIVGDAVTRITSMAVDIDYNPARLLAGIQSKDWVLVQAEVMVLKNLIIEKLNLPIK